MSAVLAAAEGLRDVVVGLSGWRRHALALAAGALAVAALPPVHAIVALVPSFVVLAWLVDGAAESGAPHRRRAWRAAVSGWWFGLGFFVAGLYWITHSFLVDAAAFAWLIPFGVTGIAAVAALYVAAVTAATVLLGAAGPGRLLAFAGLWVGAEWLRGWLLTGFPWNLLAIVWMPVDGLLQTAALGGAYLLSLLTVTAAILPAALGDRRISRRLRWGVAISPYALLAVAWGIGAVRLAGAEDAVVDNVRLRLVQPNIAQRDKWRPELRRDHMASLLALSRAPFGGAPGSDGAGSRPTHVIWPETAVPFILVPDSDGFATVADAAPAGGTLITGALRGEWRDGDRQLERLWNSLVVISDGRVTAAYDKVHLVPFGEYVPFRRILPIDKITPGRLDFSSGGGRSAIEVPGAPPISPLICYEAIFPHRVVPAGGPRPGWLLNITNDAWFGISSGPYQHFAASRLRAVEEGLPLVRVANTGVSGVMDAYGRVTARAGLGRRAVLDAQLPAAQAPTLYARFGDAVPLILCLVVVGAGRVRVLE